jgi:O-acetyl-ADP-ribose deacetylase (regulator of RNase III)
MARGGRRKGSGAKSPWKNTPTMTIRVPKVLAERLLQIAKRLDQQSVDSMPSTDFVEDSHVTGSNIGLEISSALSPRKGTPVQLAIASYDQNFPAISELEFQDMARKSGIESLYYIVYIDNVESILNVGILSHRRIEAEEIQHMTIYNEQVIDRRAERLVVGDKTLWDFANLYFQPRNAMLYSIIHKVSINEVVIIAIKREILKKNNVFITNGNAASYSSDIIAASEAKHILKDIRNETDKDWWNNDDGSKRKIMAECLVPECIPPDYIQTIYVPTSKAKSDLEARISTTEFKLPVVVAPDRFFQPDARTSITPLLSLVKGDMFFSKMQTLTISVNCVGVMGKGLASTAKSRFPDVYVKYEDLCKSKSLRLGKPFIHKRESSVLKELGDDAFVLSDLAEIDDSLQTWFMLFPTKDHWKSNSKLEEIEAGLQWFLSNYKSQGVKSVAFPALGCGNGQLSWRDVGPLMCKYLESLDIQVVIYLPAESTIPHEWMERDFLLGSKNTTDVTDF